MSEPPSLRAIADAYEHIDKEEKKGERIAETLPRGTHARTNIDVQFSADDVDFCEDGEEPAVVDDIQASITELVRQKNASVELAPLVVKHVLDISNACNELVERLIDARARDEQSEGVWMGLHNEITALMKRLEEGIIAEVKGRRCELILHTITVRAVDDRACTLGEWIKDCGSQLLIMSSFVVERGDEAAKLAITNSGEAGTSDEAEAGSETV